MHVQLCGTLFIFCLCFAVNRWSQSHSAAVHTFTHPPVLAQHVAGGTLALVRAHHVDTAEGTQERILGALVDVWRRSRVKKVAGETASWENAVRNFYIPSQVIMEPGSKPSSHAHSKPPMTLVHVPLPQGLPMLHSLVSVEQLHRYSTFTFLLGKITLRRD